MTVYRAASHKLICTVSIAAQSVPELHSANYVNTPFIWRHCAVCAETRRADWLQHQRVRDVTSNYLIITYQWCCASCV